MPGASLGEAAPFRDDQGDGARGAGDHDGGDDLEQVATQAGSQRTTGPQSRFDDAGFTL